MGVPPEWRKLLHNLLAKWQGVFGEALPPERAAMPFDVIILDGMQELALVKTGDTYQSGPAIATLVKTALYRYVTPMGFGDSVAARLVVACFDHMHAVPRNKAAVEASRDHAGTIFQSPAEFDTLVAAAAKMRVHEERLSTPHATGSQLRAMEENLQRDYSVTSHLLVTRQSALPADGTKVWRNASLSWQLRRLVTQAVLEMQVPEGKVLLLDDGIVLNEKRYAELARHMVADHGYQGRDYSELARASLIGQLMGACVERVMLLPQRRYRLLPSTKLGESDHKILYYVQRTLPLGLERTAASINSTGKISYLVKCQDTDVLWALLSHVPTALINPTSGVVDEVDVWLDSQTPQDRANGISRPYRFINVVACWRALHAVLVQEFPTLKNPFEAFLALVFCSANDYVEAFASPLKIGPATLWNVWAQALCASAGRPDYPSFSVEGKREKVPATFPRAMAGITDDWVAVRVPPPGSASPAVSYQITLRHEAAMRFFYGVVQRSPLLSGYGTRFKEKSAWAQQGRPYESNPRALLELMAHLAALATEAGDPDVPPLLAVPGLAGMRARIARINWTLDYYVNGWKTPDFTYSWFATKGEYSRHGWTRRNVTGGTDDEGAGIALGSQYFYAEYAPPHKDKTGETVSGRYRMYAAELAAEVCEPMY